MCKGPQSWPNGSAKECQKLHTHMTHEASWLLPNRKHTHQLWLNIQWVSTHRSSGLFQSSHIDLMLHLLILFSPRATLSLSFTIVTTLTCLYQHVSLPEALMIIYQFLYHNTQNTAMNICSLVSNYSQFLESVSLTHKIRVY